MKKKTARYTLTSFRWKTAILSWYGLKDRRYISVAGTRYFICSVRWSSNNIAFVDNAIKIGETCWQWNIFCLSFANWLSGLYHDSACIYSIITYFSCWPCYFVDNISEYNILIVQRDAEFFPLDILTQTNIVSQKRMWNTENWSKRERFKVRHLDN